MGDRTAQLEFIAHAHGVTLDEVAEGFLHLMGELAAHPVHQRAEAAEALFGLEHARRLFPLLSLHKHEIERLRARADDLGLSGRDDG